MCIIKRSERKIHILTFFSTWLCRSLYVENIVINLFFVSE